jgi:ribosome-associated protein
MPPKRSEKYSSREKALIIFRSALQRKPLDPVLLDVRKTCSFADYFLILSGSSVRQVQALADHLDETLGKQGIRLRGLEGRETGQWILMDFDDVIVHIFFEQARAFYDLEGLWMESPRLPLPEEGSLTEASL